MRPIADQTLQELEGVDYGEPTYNSFVVTNTHRLRRRPIKQVNRGIGILPMCGGRARHWSRFARHHRPEADATRV